MEYLFLEFILLLYFFCSCSLCSQPCSPSCCDPAAAFFACLSTHYALKSPSKLKPNKPKRFAISIVQDSLFTATWKMREIVQTTSELPTGPKKSKHMPTRTNSSLTKTPIRSTNHHHSRPFLNLFPGCIPYLCSRVMSVAGLHKNPYSRGD